MSEDLLDKQIAELEDGLRKRRGPSYLSALIPVLVVAGVVNSLAQLLGLSFGVTVFLCLAAGLGMLAALKKMRNYLEVLSSVHDMGFESVTGMQLARAERRERLGEANYQRIFAAASASGRNAHYVGDHIGGGTDLEERRFRAAAHGLAMDGKLAIPKMPFRFWHPLSGFGIAGIDLYMEQVDILVDAPDKVFAALLGGVAAAVAWTYTIQTLLARGGWFVGLLRALVAGALVLIPTAAPGILFAGIPAVVRAVKSLRLLRRQRLRLKELSTERLQ